MNALKIMNRRTKTLLCVMGSASLIILTLLAGWGSGGGRNDALSLAGRQPVPASQAGAAAVLTGQLPAQVRDPIITDDQAATGAVTALKTGLQKLAQNTALSADERAGEAMQLLHAFRQSMAGVAPDAAARAINQYLNSGLDARTGLGFSPGAGGALEEAPSMRTALLDLLASVDPAASIEQARRVFEASQSPEEWALALRNLGWQDGQGQYAQELRQRFSQMLGRDAWLSQPGQAVLEAFDIAVHLGGTHELRQMISLVRPVDAAGKTVENGLTHAAYLALDRLTLNNPEQTFRTVLADPGALAWSPAHRAGLLSRADVTVPGQLQELESYLAALQPGSEELKTFVRLFPNHNGSLSHNLVTTPSPPPHHARLVEQDQASLKVVQGWIAAGRFAAIDGDLSQIASRLSRMLGKAE